MGATKGAVMRVFLITGAAIGVVGTLAGFLLGILFCQNIESVRVAVQWMTGAKVFNPDVYYLTKMPAEIDAFETGHIVVMALVLVDPGDALSVVAGLPARSRRSPSLRVRMPVCRRHDRCRF